MTQTFSKTVLVVDDEKMITDVLEVLLRRPKLTARTAATAAEAIELIKREQFGCALIDKNLPDQSGLQVLAELRQTQPLCGCIIMTGYTNYDSLMTALRMGAADYIEKPFPDLNLLMDKVIKLLDRQEAVFQREQLAQQVEALRATLRANETELSQLRQLNASLQSKYKEVQQELGAIRTPVHLMEVPSTPTK